MIIIIIILLSLFYADERQICKALDLTEDGLVLAAGAEVASEALAEAVLVVAKSAARAVAARGGSVSSEDISTRRAFLEGAVRAAESRVADASEVLVAIPGARVGRLGDVVNGDVGERLARAMAVAVIGADGALARDALVAVEAGALARFSVADALVRALDVSGVTVRVRGGDRLRLSVGYIDP